MKMKEIAPREGHVPSTDFHVHAVFRKFGPNNSLTPLLFGVGAPPEILDPPRNILCRNFHIGPRQGQRPGAIVCYCASPILCNNSGVTFSPA